MPKYLYELLRHNAKEARVSGDLNTANWINKIQIPAYSWCAKYPYTCLHWLNCRSNRSPSVDSYYRGRR